MSVYTQEQVNYLVEGKLDWETTMRMLSMPKDQDRFRMYLNTLQSKLSWDDKLILPISLHLYIAQNKKTKEWVTKCSCGHEFGGYRARLDAMGFIYCAACCSCMPL
jgi:acetone carboxylase gamma subunit